MHQAAEVGPLELKLPSRSSHLPYTSSHTLCLTFLHLSITAMATTATIESGTAAQKRSLPTILLVQGSFQIPQVYEKLVKGLEDRGYPTIHPQLPSCSNVDSPNFPQLSLVDDASAIHKELSRLIESEGRNVVVVMHSYGGLVGSEATTEELSYTNRQARGLPGGVIHLFFYTAFLLQEGQSVLGVFGESPNNDVKVRTLRIPFPRSKLTSV